MRLQRVQNITRSSTSFESYLYILPALALFVFVIAGPIIMGFGYSLTDWSGITNNMNYIGFDNYTRLFKDKVFFQAIKNTLFITIVVTFLQNFFGLMLAVFVNDKSLKGKNAFRSLLFIPSLLSIIVIGYTWLFILNPHVGTLGEVLKSFGITTGLASYDVFIHPKAALWTVALTMVWQFSGYTMVIYLAGLQSIPEEIYESSEIDGASPVQKFLKITLPMLASSITISVFLTMIGCLKTFEQIYIMTKGGPGTSTETVGTFIYNSAFSGNQMGYGSAISTVLFLGILVLSLIQVKLFRSREVEL